MQLTKGYAARSKSSPLAPLSFERRDPGPTDVQIDILFCGVCHSDLHTARGEWGGTTFPCVPGHEIVGRVVKAGGKVLDYCAERGSFAISRRSQSTRSTRPTNGC